MAGGRQLIIGYFLCRHQEEIGIAKRPVPAHELETLKQKGEAMASRLLAEIDRPDLNIQTLKEKVNSERQQKVKKILYLLMRLCYGISE